VAAVKKQIESAGGTLSRGRLSLAERPGVRSAFERAYRRLGANGRPFLESTGGAVAWVVEGIVEVPSGGSGPARISLLPDGSPQGLTWSPLGSLFDAPDPKTKAARSEFIDRFESLIAPERPRTGADLSFSTTNFTVRVRPLVKVAGTPDQSLVLRQPGNGQYQLALELSDPDAPKKFDAEGIMRQLYRGLPAVLLFLLTAVLFGVLLYRRRLGFRVALALAVLAALYTLAGGVAFEEANAPAFVIVLTVAGKVLLVLYLLGLWAVAESMLRDTVPGFTTSLDAFAAGTIGPRGGRAILAGLGMGLGLFGSGLLLFSIAARTAARSVYPETPSFGYPVFGDFRNPLFEGTYETAVFMLLVALLRFVLPRKWAGVAGAALFALWLSNSTSLHPWGAALVLSLVLSILYREAFERYGLAALLVAALSSALMRDAAVSAMFLPESILPAILTLVPLAALAVLGYAGLGKPEREDQARIEAPEYVRRLESERRVKYEMDLLSRMQLSLLPEKPPHVAGLELAVKTVLATEAGGDLYDFVTDDAGELWIAAGDVSGHGYSCGIQQAMVMAALSSLVKAGRSPGEILEEVDRVLRMGRSGRLFTSLALLRFDVKAGRAVFANAGHPFPLLLAGGRCIEVAAPGLPLGQGPPRSYADQTFDLPAGGILVIASDGLFEGPDRFDAPYGYDRPRALLESASLWRRPAESIVEALFADWRLHVGEGAPADDTTVLAVKRPLF
jgi:serine phosphatase RsbU (regulator of sigma subunit)